ncbi:MAG: ATP-binding cassette domain-containing protein, partial [Bacteroidales bacterium]|nr:ATP-binding cassette domain-containing protein [Bacteroidales bacterium]
SLHNLKNIDVTFMLHAFNVVTGVSGAGKSSLVNEIVAKRNPLTFREMTGWETIDKVIAIDQSPIGKTSRSNPATYTGLFDHIRDLYSSLPQSKERGYSKSRFSFNTSGGRCESCQGGGFHQTGMHFLGTVEVICSTCQGKRFDDETLEVKYLEKNIAEVLDLTITDAILFFSDQQRILGYLNVLEALGLGYLHLGQRSSTLSGGEAQRIKLATELSLPAASHTLYLLDEPTTGLHQADVAKLLEALHKLVKQQHTVIVIEHHHSLILAADHVIDLGPGSGKNGGAVVATGTPQMIMETPGSLTGKAMRDSGFGMNEPLNPLKGTYPLPFRGGMGRGYPASRVANPGSQISFSGVTTNNLKGVDVSIPYNKITVITGVSGSGKSSLAFDTIYAEGRNRFLESFSAYARAQMGIKEKPDFEEAHGLTPTFAVDQRDPGNNPRSTVGTYTGIYDILRLLFSRFALRHPEPLNPLKGTYSLPFRGGPGRGHSRSGIHYPVLSSLFSFNEQLGACPHCDGLGSVWVCSPAKLVTHPERSLLSGALDGTKTGRFYGEEFGQYVSILKAVGERHAIEYSKPWSDLTAMEKQLAMEGTGEENYDVSWHFKRKDRTGEHHFTGKWIGFSGLVNQEYKRKHADHRGEEMKSVLEEIGCPECLGKRLNLEALSYQLLGVDIASITALPVMQLEQYMYKLPNRVEEKDKDAVSLLTNEINQRLEMLLGMGLGYLSLSRAADSLSGGEFQRIKLAGQMGSGLTGITYVLDEPTAGLHPVDTAKLLKRIDLLRNSGNTILMVEHDPEVINRADFVIDMGPGAGNDGGEIIAMGTPTELIANPHSVTGPFLKKNRLQITSHNRSFGKGIRVSRISHLASRIAHRESVISITDATLHNLNHLSVSIPAGGIVAVTGISGSGKSTLVHGVIHESWLRKRVQGCREISGLRQFDRVIAVHQKRHFRESRGTAATFSGIFETIRDLFANTSEAARLGLKKPHFSFLSPQGACDQCNGRGELRISMDFMADVRITCEKCHGNRYQEPVLQVAIQGKNIADILLMTFREAVEFFSDCSTNPGIEARNRRICASILGMLQPISEIGLGYLILGQSLETLSGGEAQRLTLAHELIYPKKGTALFLFDEPSSGLHPADLPALLALFDRLVDQGHSIILIEHNPEIILHADWVIDLGPGSGDQGGNVVASCQPEDILNHPNSHTGKFLAGLTA